MFFCHSFKKHSPAVICIPISSIEPELMGKCFDISLGFFFELSFTSFHDLSTNVNYYIVYLMTIIRLCD